MRERSGEKERELYERGFYARDWVHPDMYVYMCVRGRERRRESVYVRACMRERERERERELIDAISTPTTGYTLTGVFTCVRDREIECVCVCV